MSGYIEALEAAGATIHAHESFGDYQGTYLVYLTYGGTTGVIEFYYGSCSVCDDYQIAFSGEEFWDRPPTQEQLAEFGRDYLTDIQDPKSLLTKYEDDASWDMEAEGKLGFLKTIIGQS